MKQILLTITITIGLFQTINGQRNNSDAVIYQFAEVMPKFTDGDVELKNYIALNFKAPDNNCFVSRIRFSFVVETDGTISNRQVIILENNISLRTENENMELCKQEWIDAGIDLLSNMPKWISGRNKNEKVRVKLIIPLHLDPQKEMRNN
jgi:hypothetical protein